MTTEKGKFGFIENIRSAYSDESVLIQVTADDPLTHDPCYGEILAHSKSRLVIVDIHHERHQRIGPSPHLALYILHGSVHRSGRSEVLFK